MKLFTILCLFLILSCEKETKSDGSIDLKSQNTLSFNSDSTSIHWVAYKFTSKIGVKGVFDTFVINNINEDGSTPQKMFVGADFRISMRSINSGLKMRDDKLIKYFFQELKGAEMLTGKLISLNEKGEGKMSYTMNGRTSEIDVKSTLEENIYTLSGTLDLEKHNAQAAIKALNDACGKNHIGPDGVSKMWPDIDFKIVTKL